MEIKREADPELVAGVAADFSRVRDWSVFWRPVGPSVQGRDYGRAVAYATGWGARYDDLGPNSGPKSIQFKLPSGGSVRASENNVRLTNPRRIWSATLERRQLTPQQHQQARDLAAAMVDKYVAVMAQHLGRPDVGPAGYRAKEAPPGLRLNHDGVIAAWRRQAGTIQISAVEIDMYETEPIELLISVYVLPAEARHHG